MTEQNICGEWKIRSIADLEYLDRVIKPGELDFIGDIVVWEGYVERHPLHALKHSSVTRIRFSTRGNRPFNVNVAYAVEDIINKYLQGDRDILMCQDELIEAGLAEWANL